MASISLKSGRDRTQIPTGFSRFRFTEVWPELLGGAELGMTYLYTWVRSSPHFLSHPWCSRISVLVVYKRPHPSQIWSFNMEKGIHDHVDVVSQSDSLNGYSRSSEAHVRSVRLSYGIVTS